MLRPTGALFSAAVATVGPRVLERSDITATVGFIAGRVKAPAVGRLLEAAGCADPMPHAGKRSRLRAAITATQQRDGHGESILRLIESVSDAEEAEERRAAGLRAVYRPDASGASPRARIKARDGFTFAVGVGYGEGKPCATITLLPDLEGTPVRLDPQQVSELQRELRAVADELARRASPR